MIGSTVASSFFTLAGAGILAALLMSPRAELGRFYSALHGGLALACLMLVLPWRSGGEAPWAPSTSTGLAGLACDSALLAGLLAFLFITILYLPQGRGGRGVLPGGRSGLALLWLAAASAALAVGLDGWSLAAGHGRWLHVASAEAAGFLVGVVIVAMNLGHFYLVRFRLSERHLVRFARLMGVAVAVRGGLLLIALGLYGRAAPGGLAPYLRGVAVDRGFFFWQRVFFGLLGPAVFAWMVHETARIRSTQSATGILYIAVIFVMIGEFLARYLTVHGAGPM
jgi:hypothetical protein